MPIIKIDGSIGEGGGQILRTSISLSMATNTAVQIYNIRSKRPNPGIQPQHYMALKAAAAISGAEITGLKLSSESIFFEPQKVSNKISSIDIGTAGSIPLVLQALIPSLVTSSLRYPIELIGGTDVKWSPTIDYIRYIFSPFLKIIGIKLYMEIRRRGYYPRGGGRVVFEVENVSFPKALKFNKISKEVVVRSVCSNLPKNVAERQASAVLSVLQKSDLNLNTRTFVADETALSPGTSVLVYSTGEFGPFIGSDSIGEKGKPAEKVGEEAALSFLNEFSSSPDVDTHLSDMVIPYLFLSPYASKVKISRITRHLETNLFVSSLFIRREYFLTKQKDGSVVLDILSNT